MKTAFLLRHLLPAVLLFPLIVHAESRVPLACCSVEGGSPVASNVPLNEVSVRAFRYFHKEWSAITDEVWYKTDKEFIVTFTDHRHLRKAFFTLKGAYIYSLEYYTGSDMAPGMAAAIENKYPGYQVKVVTEVAGIDKSAYYITLENTTMIKTLSIINGKMEVTGEMINANSLSDVLAQN